jgi:hypothetical protein
VIPEPMPERMRVSTLEYVVRHQLGVELRDSRLDVLSAIADRDRDRDGRTAVADVDLDELVGPYATRRSLDRALDWLLDDGSRLRLQDDHYVVVGAAEHDCLGCDKSQCVRDVALARRRAEVWDMADRVRSR